LHSDNDFAIFFLPMVSLGGGLKMLAP
jgi:hypothetical protein